MSSPRRRRRAPMRASQGRPPAPARNFWGTDDTEDNRGRVITPSTDATALIESLGPPPFPGGEIAEHYFHAVYERAAALALALAIAAGLLESGEPD